MRTLAAIAVGLLFATSVHAEEEPTLEELRAQFVELREDLDSEQAKFDARYGAELEKLEAAAKEAGDLKLLLLARQERAHFADGKRPDAAALSEREELARLQKIYLAEQERLRKEQKRKEEALIGGYEKRLEALVKRLTKAGKVDDALKAQAELDLLADRKVVDVIPPEGALPKQVFGSLSVVEYRWDPAKPRVTPFARAGLDLPAMIRIQGKWAGGGEQVAIARKPGHSAYRLVAQTGQPNLSVNVYAIRDPRLDLHLATARFVDITAGEERKQLIHNSRGFCYLGGVWGAYKSDARSDVVIDPEDGFYYLSAKSASASTGARAVVVEYPIHKTPRYSVRTVSWKTSGRSHRLIAATEGICLMSGIQGAFEGTAEIAKVALDADGIWWAALRTRQRNTRVTALVIQFEE